MDKKDEINQINEIINKLDIIQDDEWQQQEGETLEEYNDRMESIEEDLEEELLDYISDSLLVEQEINEEEAIREAQEKIKNDYELFNEAFIKAENGTITLKSEEELASLGYNSPEEIEKLKEIEENMNNPEAYINKIKESIRASKDIDAEIDRKMELAKSIISAKKRGENFPIDLNSSLEKDKFERANEYIANTTTLRKIPIIQREYINSNYIAEIRYNNFIRNNINNNTNNRNNAGSRTTTATCNSQTYSSVATTTMPKVVTKKIPERKNAVYTNFEKKLDKDNDLTKQKIKARTELKSIFKKIEDKELSKEEVEELNSKIESIKKKYPNTITDKTLNKLYDTFKVTLPTVEKEQEHENTEKENDSELKEIQQDLNESLEKINNQLEIEKDENKPEIDDLKKQAEEVGDLIKEPIKEPEITKIRTEQSTSIGKNKTLGALVVGNAIRTTIDTIKQKGEKKIEQLKKKSEEVVENIAQQQKNNRKKKVSSTSKKETKAKKEKVETPKVDIVPIIQTHADSSKNKTKKKNDIQQKAEPKDITSKAKMSREELLESLKKAEMHSTEYIHTKGINLLIINKLICYLQDNNDPEIQKRLNKEITKLQTDRHKNTDKLFIYNTNDTDVQTLKYMYNSYKDGVKSNDGSRDIISANPNAAAYYLYLAYNVAKDINSKGNERDKKEIIDKYECAKEETCYRYFEFLKEKYKIDELSGIERLKVEPDFMRELTQSQFLPNKTEYLDIAISKEILSRRVSDEDKKNFTEIVQKIEQKIDAGQTVDSRTLKLVGDLYYSGLKDTAVEDIIPQDKRKASKIYEQIINNKDKSTNEDIYSNLLEIYNDNTSPLYDRRKADQLTELAIKNRISIKGKNKKTKKIETSTYVCSDLHGEYPAYQAIISQLKEKDKLYILGDAIDRGPDGIKILQDIMKRKEKGQVEFLIGNHELMMLQSLFLGDKKQEQIWTSTNNEGKITKETFEKLSPSEQSEIKEFLLDSYVYKNINVNSQKVHLVHAKAVQNRDDNRNETVREMFAKGKEKLMGDAVWSRGSSSLFSSEPDPGSAKEGAFTVIGHSPTENNLIQFKNGYLNIDCGAGQGCFASLVNLTKGVVKYFNVAKERRKEVDKQQEK